MRKKHIAFIVANAHGHLNPTLSITSELVRRGYHVTYPVKEYFAPRILANGGEALEFRPLENFKKMLREMQKETYGEYPFEFRKADVLDRMRQLSQEENQDALVQLDKLYGGNKPDLIIYDIDTFSGKLLALKWGIATVGYTPMMVSLDGPPSLYDEDLVLVSIPRFFQPHPEKLDGRFHFIDPSFSGRTFFKPWKLKLASEKTILVSSTTGLLPQTDFFKIAIDALEELSYHVVLSIGSDINPSELPPLPHNFDINQHSSHISILEHSVLNIGQGGQGSILEALYCGVPMLLIPPSIVHGEAANRIAELELGICLSHFEASAQKLKKLAISLLGDNAIRDRVKQIQTLMRESDGPKIAADLIERHCH